MIEVKPTKYLMPNEFDKAAARWGLSRHPGETNREFRDRILDTISKIRNSSEQGLVNAISTFFDLEDYNTTNKATFVLSDKPAVVDPSTREILPIYVYINDDEKTQVFETDSPPEGWILPEHFNIWNESDGLDYIIWRYSSGTYSRILQFKNPPDTDAKIKVVYFTLRNNKPFEIVDTFSGQNFQYPSSDHVKLYKFTDRDFIYNEENGFINPSGLPTDKLKGILNYLHSNYSILWDKFYWDEMYWSDVYESMETIPTLYDTNPSGCVGFINSLSGIVPSGRTGYISARGNNSCALKNIHINDSEEWIIDILPGFFYYHNLEMYLYSQKRMRRSELNDDKVFAHEECPQNVVNNLFYMDKSLFSSGVLPSGWTLPEYLTGSYTSASGYPAILGDELGFIAGERGEDGNFVGNDISLLYHYEYGMDHNRPQIKRYRKIPQTDLNSVHEWDLENMEYVLKENPSGILPTGILAPGIGPSGIYAQINKDHTPSGYLIYEYETNPSGYHNPVLNADPNKYHFDKQFVSIAPERNDLNLKVYKTNLMDVESIHDVYKFKIISEIKDQIGAPIISQPHTPHFELYDSSDILIGSGNYEYDGFDIIFHFNDIPARISPLSTRRDGTEQIIINIPETEVPSLSYMKFWISVDGNVSNDVTVNFE